MVEKANTEFECPKYLQSLIAAINDGAKAAQAGAIALSLLGLYLFLTSIATTDTDLFLGTSTTVSQFGLKLSTLFSFAFAPLLFIAVHIFTVIRYDMLSTNVAQFNEDLPKMVPGADNQERCRNLFANVEFLQSLQPPNSKLYSQLYFLVTNLMIGAFPLFVLVFLQISFLRDQNLMINIVQRLALFFDIALLVWFYSRQRLRFGLQIPHWRPALIAIIFANLVWLGVPGENAWTITAGQNIDKSLKTENLLRIIYAPLQPLDILICPITNWGCRYLNVKGLVIAQDDSDAVSLDRHSGGSKPGPYVMGRSLMFAKLDGLDLSGATFDGSTLKHASLQNTQLNNASFVNSDLAAANLTMAQLQGANLSNANLQETVLIKSNLGGAIMRDASLQAANLEFADLRGPTFLKQI